MESDGVRKALESITKNCQICEHSASKPRHFRLSIGTDDIIFNHVVAVDVMYLQSKPLLHVVCEATHYQAARFLPSMSADDTWKAFVACWCQTYLGPPDYLRVDQGSNFVAKSFLTSAIAENIHVLEAPVENPASMTHVERYHGPLRHVFDRMKQELSEESDKTILQYSIKAINDTVGPEGLTPTLLVYGSLPRPARNIPAATQVERARAIESVRNAVAHEYAKRKVSYGFKHRGPVGRERGDLERLHFGAKIAIYRDDKGWTGPERFVSLDGDTVVVQMFNGRKLFRSSVIKPWTKKQTDQNSVTKNDELLGPVLVTENPSYDSLPTPLSAVELEAMFGESGRIPVTNDAGVFLESRKAELLGLQQQGMFRVVKCSSVPPHTRVYGTRWVDTQKSVKGQQVPKSRLVATNYRDHGARSLPTRSPTVTKAAQRVVIATAASMMSEANVPYVRDIKQAYTQATTKLVREVYLRAPKEMELGDDEILLCVKPLYGIPEAGLHWFLTYVGHHVKELGMTQSKADKGLLYRIDDDGGVGVSVTALQVDDNFGHGTSEFLTLEEKASNRFRCKPRVIIEVGDMVTFNGSEIVRKKFNVFVMRQQPKLRAL
jgi:hypothetical protein